MDNLTFATIGRFFTYGIFILFLTSCANKDVAEKAYNSGDYNTSFKIWQRWADAGYGNANLKLAQMAEKGVVKEKSDFIIKHATKAYEAGEKKAAFVLENLFAKEQKYTDAFKWMQRGDINSSSNRDVDTHLFLIDNYIKSFQQQSYYLQEITKLSTNGNSSVSYKLGKFYQNKNSIFYNIDKSISFYKLAYKAGNMKAGIEIALMDIYRLNKRKEGIKLLKEIAQKGDAKASLFIGKYIYKDINTVLEKYNTPCISCSFKTPFDFYVKKLTLLEIRKLYLKNNVAPWFKQAYKEGNIDGMFALIHLDILENNFKNRDIQTYSGMNLEKTINFLNGLSSESFKAKMLLAQLYIKNPQLHKIDVAKQNYLAYMDQNQTDAEWNLYKFYKKFYPNDTKKTYYLDKLLSKDFQAAKIEEAYNNILQNRAMKSSYSRLQFAADREDIKALQYLSSLALKKQNTALFCKLSKKICHLDPLNQTNDLQVAKYYLQSYKKDKKFDTLTKAATIYQFYAEQNNTKAQYKLANIYKKFCDFDKTAYWYTQAKELGDKQALFAYARMVLEGEVQGDIPNTLQTVQNYSNQGDVRATLLLGDLYATGNTLAFNPDKAISYYTKALKKDDATATYAKILTLYNKLNVDHYYDKKIVTLYKYLIYEKKEEQFKLSLAKFWMTQNKNMKAIALLKTVPLEHYPQAKYYLYQLTGKMFYIHNSSQTNNGNLLLAYAQHLSNSSRRKALLYAFRAALCNTPDSGPILYDLMRFINDSAIIKNIYKEAKSYPECSNLQ
jgi:hypothetical protein